jgi:hypothetical protein
LIHIKHWRREPRLVERGLRRDNPGRIPERRSDQVLRTTIALAMSVALIPLEAHAFDLSGAWATQVDQCKEVFVRKGPANRMGFAPMSEQHGGGFIAEPDRLRGKFANCKIKNKKQDGQTINIVAACATDIMLSNVQFTLKALEADKISRAFPGMPDMEIAYYRCAM